MTELLKDYPIQLIENLSWSDMDAYDHINNAVFFRYFENARMLCFEQIGMNAYMQEHKLGPILATTQASYKAPLVYPDSISIGIKIGQIDEKKFLTEYAIYSHNTKAIACYGSGLVVYYDYNLNQSCAIPDEIRQRLIDLKTIIKE